MNPLAKHVAMPVVREVGRQVSNAVAPAPPRALRAQAPRIRPSVRAVHRQAQLENREERQRGGGDSLLAGLLGLCVGVGVVHWLTKD